MLSPFAVPSTHVYKKVGSLEIKLDVYMPPPHTEVVRDGKPIPILIHWHGGGLLMGHRTALGHHMKLAPFNHGVCLVCPDYRFAPQASLVEILQDVRDAIAWTRDSLPTIAKEGGGLNIDSERLAVSGSSAGGYLTLLSGLPSLFTPPLLPPPKVLLAIYPITNPLGPFFSTPQRPVSDRGPNGRVILEEEMSPHVDPKAQVIAEYRNPGQAFKQGTGDRWEIYDYMVQEGILAKLLFANAPPGTNIEDFIPAKHFTKNYPPTFITHGDVDQSSGIEQARSVVEAFKSTGVTYKYEEIPNKDHEFDLEDGEEMNSMYEFMKKYL